MSRKNESWSFGVFCGLLLASALFMLGIKFNVISGCQCFVDIKIQQSPHEKQEEPRLVSTPKIPEDERFIF